MDRASTGATNHAKGQSAEITVERHYVDVGATLLERRWRGQGGEIDLIFRQGADVVFVEVKSSATHEQALQNLSRQQIARLSQAAEEYLGTQPQGSLTPMRLDVAMVDAIGQVEILENALMSL